VKTAAAIHADLLTGKREAELAAIRAEALEADAGLVLARKERDRAASLAHTGTAAQSRLDAAQAQVATFEARIARIKASEAAAMLPARPEDIAAAHSRVEEARAAAAEIRQRIADLAPRAPVTAEVEDAFFSAGEWVAAGQPVVSLLQPGEMTLRFFVPEAALSLAQPGQEIRYTCDGCGDLPGRGRIVRTASTPEFTPPVIYSQGARAKLVFRVEAKPQDARSLRPGLPIEVEPLQ
jgi:HlyD family secretion protein